MEQLSEQHNISVRESARRWRLCRCHIGVRWPKLEGASCRLVSMQSILSWALEGELKLCISHFWLQFTVIIATASRRKILYRKVAHPRHNFEWNLSFYPNFVWARSKPETTLKPYNLKQTKRWREMRSFVRWCNCIFFFSTSSCCRCFFFKSQKRHEMLVVFTKAGCWELNLASGKRDDDGDDDDDLDLVYARRSLFLVWSGLIVWLDKM